MEFQEILIDSPLIFAFLSFIIGAIGAILIISSVLAFRGSETDEIEPNKKAGFVVLGIGAFLLVFSFVSMSHNSNMWDKNDEALVSNIEKKYDVDEVVLSSVDVGVVAEKEKPQNVNVVVDGKTYAFYLSQDKDTWEPTLTNPAIPGGSSETETLSAEDLLR